MPDKLILTNERTGYKLIDVSKKRYSESVLIRTEMGQGWALPTENFEPEDFRKLADYLEKIRNENND